MYTTTHVSALLEVLSFFCKSIPNWSFYSLGLSGLCLCRCRGGRGLWSILCVHCKQNGKGWEFVLIFRVPQVTLNKMVHKKDTTFCHSFQHPFTWCVPFFASVSFKNHWVKASVWLFQPEGVFWADTRNKTDSTMWKGIENCGTKWCLVLCTIFVWGHLGVSKNQ